MEEAFSSQQQHKRQRKLSSWESSLTEEQKPGLSDLFGRKQSRSSETATRRLLPFENQSFLDGSFFTLRMEHREEDTLGPLARHPGEERFLLFRSDRAGSIAKIIFSSTQTADEDKAKAKVHVLDVKSEYRGKDLGGLLFSEAMKALSQRYEDDPVDCQLDAEEDVQRHNRLRHFYEQLGCEVKPNANIKYINNNDGETHRKIPMKINLNHARNVQRKAGIFESTSFLPIKLLAGAGHRAGLDNPEREQNRRLDWLVLDDGNGRVRFRTTVGAYLQVDKNGSCFPSEEEDENSFFSLHRVSDEGSDSDDSDSEEVRRKELWMLQSHHGTFLKIDSHSFACSKDPAFWQADDEDLSLTCTTDTPLRRQHYRRCWEKQTTAYVEDMGRRYGSFELAQMSLREALDRIGSIPSLPFGINSDSPSMRTLCFRAAEKARHDGQPDWVQLVSLIHELGVVVNDIDTRTAIESADDYNWTLASRSRIVGCAAPGRASFAEFRHLNADEQRFTTPQGMYEIHCGFENVRLTWTGPEYMFHMLKHNNAMIPDEGLAMLRYFTLGDWHTHSEYAHLASEDDEDMKSFVSEFDCLRRAARRDCAEEMSKDECDGLWKEHYLDIVAKYGLDGVLSW